jgi:hypothetical protein
LVIWGTPEKTEFDLRTSLLLVTGKARCSKPEKDPFAAELEELESSDKSWNVERASSTRTPLLPRVKVLESHPDGYSKALK